MSANAYRIHGIDVVVNVPVHNWPRALHSDRVADRVPWRIQVSTADPQVLEVVAPRAGRPQWRWHDVDGLTVLDVSGTPPSWDQDVATSARFCVDAEERTIVARHSHDHQDGLIDLLTRWVLPDIARREIQLVPLHACAVETGAGALLLLGDSGLGKSSLAAALVAGGAKFLGDEPICVGPQGAWPGPTALRIDPGSAESLLNRSGPLDDAGKALIFHEVYASTPRPLAGLILLQPRRAEGPLLQWDIADPADALIALMRLRYARADDASRIRDDLPRTAAVTGFVPVLNVSLLDDRDRLIEAAAELLDGVAGLGATSPS